jgi:hypothetical protein
MRRLTTVIGAAAIVLWAASAFAQVPNFAGSWVPPDGRGTIVVTQNAKTVTITPRLQGLPAVYNLDGSDSKNAIALGVDVISNAKWDGAKLVVTTHTQQGDQVTSYYMEGSDLVVERGGAGALLRTHYQKGR